MKYTSKTYMKQGKVNIEIHWIPSIIDKIFTPYKECIVTYTKEDDIYTPIKLTEVKDKVTHFRNIPADFLTYPPERLLENELYHSNHTKSKPYKRANLFSSTYL